VFDSGVSGNVVNEDQVSAPLFRLAVYLLYTMLLQQSVREIKKQTESRQQVHNKSPQRVVRQAASLTPSWTTCRTASPRQVVEQTASLTASRATCRAKNPHQIEAMDHRVCHITSIFCAFVVQHAVATSCTTNPRQIEVMELDTNHALWCWQVSGGDAERLRHLLQLQRRPDRPQDVAAVWQSRDDRKHVRHIRRQLLPRLVQVKRRLRRHRLQRTLHVCAQA